MMAESAHQKLDSSIVSLDRLREVLHYNPETGLFTWRVKRRANISPGDIAGHIDESKGYVIITLFGRHYYGHVLAWFYVHGVWTEVDHKNRIGVHNQLINLRAATRAETNRNQGVRSDNMLGVKGITRTGRKFMARIFVNGASLYLGTFETLDEAISVRQEATKKHFGEFANG